MPAAFHKLGVVPALRLADGLPEHGSAPWCCEALSGRLVELSADGPSAALSLALSLVHDTQRTGEPVAWLTRRTSSFFPPDAEAGGIDLEGLAVIRLPDHRAIFRAADRLARSGAFGLLVGDLGRGAVMPPAVQTRLAGLATKHDLVLLFLTRKPAREPSLGSLVSLRAEARLEAAGEGLFRCRLVARKDKRRAPGWETRTDRHAPPGLR